jgi:hypothetical protein
LDLIWRMGDRRSLVGVMINASEAAIRSGDWEWAASVLDQVLALDLEPADRILIGTNRALIDVLRGDRTPLVDELSSQASEGTLMEHELPLASVIADGDDAAAYDLALASAKDDLLNAPAILERAIRAALWMDDRDRATDALAQLAATGRHGAATDAIEVGLRAGLAALEGRRDDAVAAFRQAVVDLRALGATFAEALGALDGARMLGIDTPEGAEMAAIARPILERLGAKPSLWRLDGLASGIARERPSSATATEVSRSA